MYVCTELFGLQPFLSSCTTVNLVLFIFPYIIVKNVQEVHQAMIFIHLRLPYRERRTHHTGINAGQAFEEMKQST